MYNFFLDRYPESFKGYLIRFDYRIGVQMIIALSDSDLSDNEKLANALYLLFGNGAPPLDIALEGLTWFLNCSKEKSASSDNNERVSDFEYDSHLISSAFRKIYNIDITREKMHWFEFNALIADLGECAYTNTIKIRSKKIDGKMSAEERNYYTKAKEMCALPVKISKEQEESVNKFWDMLKEGEGSASV